MDIVEIKEEDILKFGVHFGSLTRYSNPKMKDYIAKRNGRIYIIDIQKIISQFLEAKTKIEKLFEKNSQAVVLFVGTSPHLSSIIKKYAIDCNSPYLVNRWPGGFLTNFKTISRNIARFKDLIDFEQSEKAFMVTRKQQTKTEKLINKRNKLYEGVVNLAKLPDLLFVIGINKEWIAIKEAKNNRVDIPVIAVCNTNCNPSSINYVIPGNDLSESSVDFLVSNVAKIIKENKAKYVSSPNFHKI